MRRIYNAIILITLFDFKIVTYDFTNGIASNILRHIIITIIHNATTSEEVMNESKLDSEAIRTQSCAYHIVRITDKKYCRIDVFFLDELFYVALRM